MAHDYQESVPHSHQSSALDTCQFPKASCLATDVMGSPFVSGERPYQFVAM